MLRTKAAEGAGIGAVAGGRLGALLTGLAAAGFPVLPIIVIGPLAAIAGGGAGGAVGAVVGALVGTRHPREAGQALRAGNQRGGIGGGVKREWQSARGEQIYRPTEWPAGRP